MAHLSKDSHIAIIGAGAWGLSTALHLHQAGYTNITVFERSEVIPSPHSAACDLNKIVRAEYEDPFYTDLALEAIEAWKSALFGPYFHQTGYVVCATGSAPAKATEHLEKALSSVESNPAFASGIERFQGREAFKKYTWQYSGPLNGFQGYYNRLAGYAHSSDTLKGIWEHCVSLGVRFVQGESAGRVAKLVYDNASSMQRCVGVSTADGKEHAVDLTICALGAHASSLIPSCGTFVQARCWSVAHVRLSEQEANFLRGIPTTNVRDLGFFFEPDPKTLLFKLCPLGIGYTNTGSDGVSLPPPDRLPPPQDFIPLEDEHKLRRLLQETFPWMANRQFVDKKLCWFADTADSDFCIDYVPGTANSLICLTGDSGHGFKMMPIFGKWVVNLLQQGSQAEPRWRWREGTGDGGADWGQAVSWRVGTGRELKELLEEEERLNRARL